ncbi:MAG: response regulator, partial [Kiloniellaceae bacterium]
LLVEDEAAVRMFGARALRNKGYKVLEADNGEGALEVIGSAGRPIDLIISDVVMPGMDGHTLIKRVRREMPHVKVILMSGYAEDVSAAEIERDPTIHFLAKPFTLKGLAGKVKELMAG